MSSKPNKYVGNKDFSNVIHFLINRLPKSKRYFSLFFGGGGLENSIYTAGAHFVCSEKNPDCKMYEVPTMATIDFFDYQDLIDAFVFDRSDFIFADPPYMFSSRTTGRKYYKYEFTEEDHIAFLDHIQNIQARVMITHPENDLYNSKLSHWNKEPFSYMTRQGMYNDCVYMNYSRADIELLNYDCLGEDFTDRQRIKRQRSNVVTKFKNLDLHVRQAIVRELRNENLL